MWRASSIIGLGRNCLKTNISKPVRICRRLLQWLEPLAPELRYGPKVELLREVFGQQYVVQSAEVQAVKEHAPGVVCNPHDPDAQWSAKGQGKEKKSWVGYKVQVAESLPEEDSLKQKCFITSIVTQKAIASDDPGLDETLGDQSVSGLQRPTELYVDGAYVSAARLQEAENQGWELIGPAQPSANRSGLGSDFRIEAFDIDIAKRRARCPNGFLSTQCSRIEEAKRQKVSFRLEWSYHCHNCSLRSQCVPAGQSHRTIVVGQYHELLQQRRRDQQSPQFKKRMRQRNAIEGTISELVRAHGLRRSRYRGFAKVELQNLFIATACNIKRWLRIETETKLDPEIDLLFFKKVLQKIQGLCRPLRLSLIFSSSPIHGVTSLTPA
jgi:transposase